jgi:hypothetical protein
MENDQKVVASRWNGESQNPVVLQRENELADVCARFADICDSFSRQNMDMPPPVLDEIGRVSKLTVPDRIAAMTQLNRDLMQYLHALGQDSGMRQ